MAVVMFELVVCALNTQNCHLVHGALPVPVALARNNVDVFLICVMYVLHCVSRTESIII